MLHNHLACILNTSISASWVTSTLLLSVIQRNVGLTPPQGFMKTNVDGLAAYAMIPVRSEAAYTFLHVIQPTPTPCATTLSPGCSTSFPFTFVVPTTLLDTSCRHKVVSSAVRTAHLSLPPSLGDHELAGVGAGTTSLDDIAPDMTKVTYGVRVRLSADVFASGKSTLIADKFMKVRILPATYEEPPLILSCGSPARPGSFLEPDYQPVCERTLRQSFIPISKKTGCLAVQAEQPASFRIPHLAFPVIQASTTVTLRLRFDPLITDAHPPRLGDVAARLNVMTFFATKAMQDFPRRSSVLYDCNQGTFHETLPISRSHMGNVIWRRHDPLTQNVKAPSLDRHDSGFSVSSAAETSSNAIKPSKRHDPSLPYYTATLVMPLRLPVDKAWIPTFYSCLVSRVYTLDLALVVDAPGAGRHIDISVPVQVSAVGSGNIATKHVVKVHDPEVDASVSRRGTGPAYNSEMWLDSLTPAWISSDEAPHGLQNAGDVPECLPVYQAISR